MADLSKLKTGNRVIDILHPGTKEPTMGITVTVMSIDDERLKALKRKITDEQLRLSQRNKGFKSTDIDDNKNALRFAAIVGWEWGTDADGEPALFKDEKPELIRKTVYDICNDLPWFAEQIDEAIGETEAFFKPSKPI